MNNLSVKTVDFFGDNLVAAKDESTGKIYTGVSYICNGIGFTKGQKDRQVFNIQNDLVLNKGCLKFEAGVIDPNNEVLAIEIEFLPLWLAKIPITPKMKEEQPEVTEKLINYQLKAKDVLAEAFINNKALNTSELSPELQMFNKMFQAVANVELSNKALEGKVQAIEQSTEETKVEIKGIREVVALNSTDWKVDSKNLIVKIAKKLGGNQFINEAYKEIYTNLERRAACQLKIRKN